MYKLNLSISLSLSLSLSLWFKFSIDMFTPCLTHIIKISTYLLPAPSTVQVPSNLLPYVHTYTHYWLWSCLSDVSVVVFWWAGADQIVAFENVVTNAYL